MFRNQFREDYRDSDIVTISLTFNVGSIFDIQENKPGISHFVEHLLLKDILGDLDGFVEENGVVFDAGTNMLMTRFTLSFNEKVYDNVFPEFLKIFKNYKEFITEEKMKHEIKIIESEDHSKALPVNFAYLALEERLGINISKENLYISELHKITLEDVFYWINKYYNYENVNVVVTARHPETVRGMVRVDLMDKLGYGEKYEFKTGFTLEPFLKKFSREKQKKPYMIPSRMYAMIDASDIERYHAALYNLIVFHVLQKHVRPLLHIYNMGSVFSIVDSYNRVIILHLDTADEVGFMNSLPIIRTEVKKIIENNLERYVNKLETHFILNKAVRSGILNDSSIDGLQSTLQYSIYETKDILLDINNRPLALVEVSNKKRDEAKYRISYKSRMKQLKEIYQ